MGASSLLQAATQTGLLSISFPRFNGRCFFSNPSARIVICTCQHRPPQQSNHVEPSGSSEEENFKFPNPLSFPNFQAFSRLPHVEWDLDSVVTFMVSYLSIFHVPLGLGGLTVIAQQLKPDNLPPQTKAVALVILVLLELGGTMWLLQSTMKRSKRTVEYFNFLFDEATGGRGWVATTLVGVVFISLAMGTTIYVAESLHMAIPDDGKTKVVKEMVSSNIITELSTFLVWCILVPCLEEIVYRGYLLQSMASRFGWQLAVVLSSIAFTFAHFDIVGAPSLFFVGCVLGTAYTWSGNLVSSLLIHSLYNALIIYGN